MKNACLKLSQGGRGNHLCQCLQSSVLTSLVGVWQVMHDASFRLPNTPAHLLPIHKVSPSLQCNPKRTLSVCPFFDKHLSSLSLDPAVSSLFVARGHFSLQSFRYFFFFLPLAFTAHYKSSSCLVSFFHACIHWIWAGHMQRLASYNFCNTSCVASSNRA